MPDCPAIRFDNVSFAYEPDVPVLEGLSFAIAQGEFVTIQGDNGSGKSTLLKLVDAMLTPDEGCVHVLGMDTADPANRYDIRSLCGIVFQNPDDQMVSTLVHDEVAFGPRNLGLCSDEVHTRVDEALRAVGMEHLRDADVNALSGGQKQRVAVAGALAMKPRILLLDEATSMLDAEATTQMMILMHRLREQGMTIVLITHDPALAKTADRVIQLKGEPEEVLGVLPDAEPACQRLQSTNKDSRVVIELEGVSFSYGEGAAPVLDDVSLSVHEGEFVALTGPNGCGKSTLLKHVNGLLVPTAGTVRICEQALDSKEARNNARRQVGLAFQHPERQLFESTVFDDVAFGPRNLGCDEADTEARVRKALADIGLSFESVYKRSPFTLSGGQQRKVALAGILAMQTPILALDEPCAGLDAQAKRELLELLCRLNSEGTTIIMVTHTPQDANVLGCRMIEM